MGTSSKGAFTGAVYTPPPRVDEGPRVVRDPRYPDMIQNGLKPSFDQGKRFHSPDFLASPSGFISPVPNNAVGPHTTRGSGVMFKDGFGGHGFDNSTSTIRVMDPSKNQGKRTVYENESGQIVNPFTGRTSMVKGHFYHDKK